MNAQPAQYPKQLLLLVQRWMTHFSQRSYALRWAFVATFVTQLFLSEWFIGNLLFISHKYTLTHALCAQPILFLEAGGWSFLTVCIASLFSRPFLRNFVAALGVAASGGVALGESLLLGAYDTVYNPEMCKSIVASDLRESTEFVASVGHYWGVILIFFVAAIIIILVVTRLLSHLKPTTFCAFGVVCFLLGFSLSIGHYRNWHWSYAPARTTTNDRFLWSTLRAIRMGQQLQAQRTTMHQAAQAAVTDTFPSPLGTDVNLILILGESTRAASMHCYGSKLSTTPHLDKLLHNGELCLFSDAVSPSNATIAATQAMLTFYTNDLPKPKWAEFPDLISVLSRGGYSTAWITNQESTGGPWSVQQLFGDAADTLTGNPYRLRRTNDLFLPDSLFYDEQVLPHLLTFRQLSPTSRHPRGLFAVVHLMGSHAGYAHRYPPHFRRFSAKDIPGQQSKETKQTIAEYHNSVFYNDYVVSQIMQHYRNEKALVIYVADHGEALFDDAAHPSFAGHAGNVLSENVLRIPLMVYASPSLRQTAAPWWKSLQSRCRRPVMTDVLSRSIAHLLGIHTRYDAPHVLLFSDDANYPHTRKVIAADGAERVIAPRSIPPNTAQQAL